MKATAVIVLCLAAAACARRNGKKDKDDNDDLPRPLRWLRDQPVLAPAFEMHDKVEDAVDRLLPFNLHDEDDDDDDHKRVTTSSVQPTPTPTPMLAPTPTAAAAKFQPQTTQEAALYDLSYEQILQKTADSICPNFFSDKSASDCENAVKQVAAVNGRGTKDGYLIFRLRDPSCDRKCVAEAVRQVLGAQ